MTILLKRAYEAAEEHDGFRILVDRIWPRGVSKDFANIDFWAKDVTPTTSLRKWFSHDPLKWEEFKKNYIAELENAPDAVDEFLHLLREHENVTFVYGAKDTKHTHALILQEYIQNRLEES
ncbi:Protein of unknown function DUF488 [Sulfurimonas denitrificans DSM 1251]|jgi:uncharacterized protein YeaO (DUF488 family)|uniref:Uroporphyrin-III C-methyltransferase n=1 Tax=Sulfurimonas denitrificans (strain ATCC 33889 / DSM 1251) TaxID=326298 RepID=Q30QK6_SULDN|nr:DUF488 family protein [Sulfurimonas denitrificans]ABB44725.1 Protein of unknown function DUF488 [Sulfurimonas denitrificans DSM 1251]MDD3443039.1 DUF488 family protein [Sulfurimonas denitrificans]